jgi:2-keto-4-pentenoate hydratase/2-oxohepta-3-ene-1,7-dioic acid hydratase in catechol pathway
LKVEEARLKVVTIRHADTEEAAVVLPDGVAPDEIEDIEALEVSTVLNGDLRRTNTVSNMIFSVWWLVSFHSRVMTLLAGDVISTGTPGAVVVREGDMAECRITGFEPLSNPVVRQG